MTTTGEVAVLLYPGCVFFEIALAAETLGQHLPVRYYALGGEPLRASNHVRLLPMAIWRHCAVRLRRRCWCPGVILVGCCILSTSWRRRCKHRRCAAP